MFFSPGLPSKVQHVRLRRRAPASLPRMADSVPKRPGRPRAASNRAVFSLSAATADAVIIALAALLSGLLYQQGADVFDTLKSGLIIALLFTCASSLRHDYSIPRYLTLSGHAEQALASWIIAFGIALTLGFMTKTTSIVSRGAIAIFFVVGFPAILLARGSLVRHIRGRAESGQLTSRTIMLVGAESEILAFIARYRLTEHGLRVVGTLVLRDESESLNEDLALAVATARMLMPDDVFLLLPWGEPDLIAGCVDIFRRLPAAIHLGPSSLLERFGDMRIDRAGPVSSVHLVRSPLSAFEILAKRAFDIVAAGSILLILLPLLLLVMIAIKLTSKGPVFFLQRRYGFNQQPFRIIKFRSMSTLEDNAALRQVTTGDVRVTRIGRMLRRTSVDELPQLINVLKGDMSLVGPRPHALAHDQQFERTIALYARRHNVRPGITGWAQVQGWRGETDTPEKIKGRIEADLQYIDNWSIWFDLSILFRTVFSSKAFRNAK